MLRTRVDLIRPQLNSALGSHKALGDSRVISDSESALPVDIVAKASRTGNELAWRRSDLVEVFSAAARVGLANHGGQVQFRFPDGTCELYWRSFDTRPRNDSEVWSAFVSRTREEAQRSVNMLPADAELVADGLTHFEFLRDKANAGADVASALCFVCYFAAEEEDPRS